MSDFPKKLRRIRRLLRTGRLAAAVCAALALAGFLWLCFALADLGAAFESPARIAITTTLIVISALAALLAPAFAVRVSTAEAATLADHALADPRSPARSALSLATTPAPTPLGEMLRQRTLDEAAIHLAAIPAQRVLPWRMIGLAALALALPLLATALFRLAAPAAFAVVSARLLNPSADLPPYSPLKFRIDPASPSTVYGGEILITAEITGGALEHPVECLIRQKRTGHIARLPAFRESEHRFSRKLDGLTDPLEISFACGKARSAWHPIELLLEPNILAGIVRITPPAYTGLKPTAFPLDTNEIAAIEGSTVVLELTSNRPLGSASMDFTPASAPGVEPIAESLTATLPTSQSAAFEWTATRSGRIAATVRDVRGTPSARPLELAFRAIPDLPPNVQLNSPPRMMMATPGAIIAVDGIAEDDHALSKVRFVRTLAGFRDRARLVAPALRDATYPFQEKLDLSELGLEAGQTIELMIEAADHNPSLLGQGSSEISRIHIISEEQYAEYIRAKTTIDQFASRFRAAREARDAAREALENLKEAAAGEDPKAAAEALENARKANQQAAELMEQIAGDFPAFELEERLRDLAEKQLEAFENNAEALKNLDPQDPDAGARIDEMLRRLERENQEAEQLEEAFDQVREAALLLEMAARFRQIYESQKSLSERFRSIVEELRQGADQNRRLLPSLGETQEKNRKALDEFKIELLKRAEALLEADPQLAPLAESALEFLNQLEVAEPESLMDAAAEKGRAGLANDAFTNAELARALLERLLSEPGEFQQAAQGSAPKFEIPQLDVNATLEQLLEALLGQNQPNQGGPGPGGQGGGPGGTGPSGNAMPGYSLDLPVAGPQRMQFDPLSSQSGAGNGEGGTARPAPLPETAESGSIRPTETGRGESSGISPENIPEPYRDAVKRYFTP